MSLRLPIYIINPVDKIKSSYLKLFHARSTADNRISQAIMFLIILSLHLFGVCLLHMQITHSLLFPFNISLVTRAETFHSTDPHPKI